MHVHAVHDIVVRLGRILRFQPDLTVLADEAFDVELAFGGGHEYAFGLVHARHMP